MFSLERHGNLQLRKSRFGHFLERGDFACAYHSLRLETLYFDRILLTHLQAATRDPVAIVVERLPAGERARFASLLKRVCDAAILIPGEYRELEYLEEVRRRISFRPAIRLMVLHLSDHCNLRCRYCFIEGGIGEGYRRRAMSAVALHWKRRFWDCPSIYCTGIVEA
jgi:hypothetical protein